MGKRERDKGHAWEREVANLLTDATGEVCKRNLTEVREGLRGGGDITSGLPISVQCKVGQAPPFKAALDQAIASALPGDIAVAVTRINGSGSRPPRDEAHMRLTDFLALVRYAIRGGWGSTPTTLTSQETH